MNESRIILAADGLTLLETIRLVKTIGSRLYAVKIHDLYDLAGPAAIEALKLTCEDLPVWVDFKLFDIPATMEKRAKALVGNGADILTVSAEAGPDGMKAVLQSGALIYAVTVLTSEAPEVTLTRTGKSTSEAVLQRAIQAAYAGVNGVVCSPLEAKMLALHAYVGQKLERITPGVRSPGLDTDDQKRFDTPANAIAAGANRLVIGRQLTKAEDPLAELRRIEEEIGAI